MKTDLQTIWTRFKSDAAACDSALIASLEIVSIRLQETARSGRETLLRQGTLPVRQPGLGALNETLTSEARALLIEPLEKYRARDPYRLAVGAFSDHDSLMEDVILAVPESVAISRREWLDVIGPAGISKANRIAMLFRMRKLPVPLRRNFLVGFCRRRLRRRDQQGEILRLLLEANMDLIGIWQVFAESRFSELSSQPSRHDLTSEIARIMKELDSHCREAVQAIAALKIWLGQHLDSVANAEAMRRDADHGIVEKLRDKYFESVEFWARQHRAVEAEVDVETGLLAAQTGISSSARELILMAEKEYQGMADELDNAIHWLQAPGERTDTEFPSGRADFVPAAQRIGIWDTTVNRNLASAPEKTESVVRLLKAPGFRSQWRVQYPRRVLERSVKDFVGRIIESVLRNAERQSGITFREIEHAREVVSFAASAIARSGSTGERQIAVEGVVNARSLLEFHRKQIQPPELEQSIAPALAAAFRHTHGVLQEIGRASCRERV